jgi:hypothetical protein
MCECFVSNCISMISTRNLTIHEITVCKSVKFALVTHKFLGEKCSLVNEFSEPGITDPLLIQYFSSDTDSYFCENQ